MDNVTNVTIFVTGNFIQWYQGEDPSALSSNRYHHSVSAVNGLCSDPDEPRSNKIEFMDSHILWIGKKKLTLL